MLIIVQVKKRDGSDAPCIIEIAKDEDIEVLKQMITVEVGVPPNEQRILFNGNELRYGTLLSNGLGRSSETEAIEVIQTTAAAATGAVHRMNIEDLDPQISPEGLISICREQPHLVDQLRGNDPDLATSVQEGNVVKVRQLLMARYLKLHKQRFEQAQEAAAIENDPFNPENQRKIAEQIRQENVRQNMEVAIENMPESFTRVHMLYVNITIQDTPIKAFVDSGAQSTIISAECAERVGLMRLLDTRFAGEARGVGTAKILGKIHIAQMKFGNSFFPISITVLERNDIDFLFGLDMLRRHRCIIDLSRNVLRIEGHNGHEELPFLDESEIGDAFGSGMEKKKSAAGDDDQAGTSTMDTTPPPEVSTTTSPPPPATSAVDSQSSPAAASASTAEKLAQLQAMGFSPIEAQMALQQADGDVDLATTLLLSSR